MPATAPTSGHVNGKPSISSRPQLASAASLTSIPSTTGSATSSSTATTVATTDSASSKVPLRLLLQPICLMCLHLLCKTHIRHRNHQLIKVPHHTRLPNLAHIYILIPLSPMLCGHHCTVGLTGLLIRCPTLHDLCKTELDPAPRVHRVVGLQLVSGVLALDLILSRRVFRPLLLKCKLICNHKCKWLGNIMWVNSYFLSSDFLDFLQYPEQPYMYGWYPQPMPMQSPHGPQPTSGIPPHSALQPTHVTSESIHLASQSRNADNRSCSSQSHPPASHISSIKLHWWTNSTFESSLDYLTSY